MSSRRTVLRAAATAGAAAAVTAATPGTAHAAKRYQPRSYTKTPLPSARERHAANRFTYGWTPGLHRQIRKAGGFNAWFDKQLRSRGMDAFTANSADWWTAILASPTKIAERDSSGVQGFWDANADYQRWAMVRRVHSTQQVREVMAEFWEHHFHVPALGGSSGPWRNAYGRDIRAAALGSFADLLHLAITHPAMGAYLDNGSSTAKAPNENLGRELLELHTVGVGNYTEDDVKSSARILTGWRVKTWSEWGHYYDPDSHWTGRVTVKDFTDPNTSPDGRDLTRRYLDHLARHPQTARRLAHKLAVRFVSDNPSETLVADLARVYLNNDTRIAPVLRALVDHPEFQRSAGKKTRTASDDVAATWRVLGTRILKPGSNPDAGGNIIIWQVNSIGLLPFGWPRPDGLPDNAQAWSSTSRFMSSLDVHRGMAGSWWPKVNTRYRSRKAWLPQRRIRFDLLVDHLSRSMHGRRSDATLLKAACQATGISPGEVIHGDHPLVRWQMPELLSVLLDHPHHFSR